MNLKKGQQLNYNSYKIMHAFAGVLSVERKYNKSERNGQKLIIKIYLVNFFLCLVGAELGLTNGTEML